MIGQSLAHYEILDSLGSGGMGEVYLALDTKLDRKVALKTLRSAGEASALELARIRREARATAALNHPGVVTVFAVEEAEGITFITMEYVAGRTLDRLIPAGGMAEETFRTLAGQLAAAVAAAHAAGITHRDLKPGNVMIDAHDRLKVLDFGLASMAAPATDTGEPALTVDMMTRPGTVLGTMPYMSPEQVCGETAAARSDVFSLGSILYRMAAGQRPFRGSSLAEFASSILRDDPVPLNDIRPAFPADLVRIIDRCLQKEPAARFADAGALSDALSQALSGAATPTTPPDRATPLCGVVDFTNISGDPAAEWLATGIAETVTVDLNKLPQVQTVPRDRIVAVWSQLEPGDDSAVLAATRRLGLDFLITGGFQKQGDRIRITGQILDVRRNAAAGTIKLDGIMDDIFELQDRVLAGLLDEADIVPGGADRGGPRPRPAGALLAYEKYSRAKAKLLHMGVKAFAEAEELLQEALELDPDYALAHTAFGQMRAMRFIATTDRRDLTEAIEHLEQASAADPDLDEPWTWRTYCLGRLDRFEEAIACGQQAISLNPARPQAHYFTGVAYWMRGASHYEPGDWDKAADHLARTVKLQPTYQPGYMARFDVLFRLGRWVEARRDAEMAAAVEASGNWEVAQFFGAETQLGFLDLAEGRPDRAARRFQVSEQRLVGSVHVYAPLFLVMNHCGLAGVATAAGDHEKALSLLKEARELGQRHPRTLGMGRVLVRVGYMTAAALAAAGRVDDGAVLMTQTDNFFESRDQFDFAGVWMNMDADLHLEGARAWDALGRPDQAAAARDLAVIHGWPSP